MPGPDAMRLPLRSAIVFAGLSFGDDEFVEHVLGVARIGAEDLEQARLRDLADREVRRAGAVGAAVGAAGQHRFHHLLRAGELERLDVEPRFLEVAFLHRGEERQAGGDRPEADADLRRRLRAHDGAARRAPRARCRRRPRRACGGAARSKAARSFGVGDGEVGAFVAAIAWRCGSSRSPLRRGQEMGGLECGRGRQRSPGAAGHARARGTRASRRSG